MFSVMNTKVREKPDILSIRGCESILIPLAIRKEESDDEEQRSLEYSRKAAEDLLPHEYHATQKVYTQTVHPDSIADIGSSQSVNNLVMPASDTQSVVFQRARWQSIFFRF